MRIEKLIEAVQEHYQLHWTQGDGGKCGGYHVKLLDVTRKHATLGKVLCFEDLDNLRRIRNCEKRTDYTYEAGLPTELASLLEDFTWDDGVLMRVLAQLGDAVLLVYRGMEAVGDAQCKRAEGWYARSGLGTFDSIDDLPEDDFNTYTDYGPDDELSDYDMDDVASGISDPDGVDDTMIWCEEEAPPAEKAISTAPSTAARSSSAVSNSDGTTYHSANSAGSSGSSATSAGAVEPDRKPSAVDGFGVSEEEWEEMSDVSEGSSLYLDDDFSDPRDGGTWISWDEFNSA